MRMKFETGDMVNSPLFGKGIVLESYGDKVSVSFLNKAFGTRVVNQNIFTADPKRLIKKKKIRFDQKEEYYNEIHQDRFITNDML